MKIQCSQGQLEGIVLLLGVLVVSQTPSNIPEQLVYNHVFKLYQKTRLKTENYGQKLTAKSKLCNLCLTENEALALYVYLQQVTIPQAQYQYEAIQILRVTNEIEKQYA